MSEEKLILNDWMTKVERNNASYIFEKKEDHISLDVIKDGILTNMKIKYRMINLLPEKRLFEWIDFNVESSMNFHRQKNSHI